MGKNAYLESFKFSRNLGVQQSPGVGPFFHPEKLLKMVWFSQQNFAAPEKKIHKNISEKREMPTIIFNQAKILMHFLKEMQSKRALTMVLERVVRCKKEISPKQILRRINSSILQLQQSVVSCIPSPAPSTKGLFKMSSVNRFAFIYIQPKSSEKRESSGRVKPQSGSEEKHVRIILLHD